MADMLKTVVREAVQYAVNDYVAAHIRDEFRVSEINKPVVEIHDISASEFQIRVVQEEGPPRYFLVKVTEQL